VIVIILATGEINVVELYKDAAQTQSLEIKCFTHGKCPAFLILIESQILIVFSTYFIFFSYLYDNQITSIQVGAFNNLSNLTVL
jgi:hypothetical protein